MYGWRTVAVKEKSILSVQDNLLRIETEKKMTNVPLDQLGHLILDAGGVTISAAALSALAGNHIHVMLCGEKHTPSCEVVPLGNHHEASGNLMDQAEWNKAHLDRIWKSVVEMKLRNQERLLRSADRNPSPKFHQYLMEVEPGDKTNKEALAARMYFRSLFGQDFRRHMEDEINSKLNYGYTILCSAFTRIIVMHGYHTGLGIHHCSRDNPVNLYCDLMEPFRPLVDQIVLKSGERKLDWELKKEFIAMLNNDCQFEENTMSVEEAVEAFILRTVKAVSAGLEDLPEVRFV